MNNKRLLVLFALAVAGAVLWYWRYTVRPMQFTISFHPYVGSEPLLLNEARYDNPGGNGQFHIRSFQFFISQLRLTADSGQFVEPESYHLVRFDNDEVAYRLTLDNIARRDYHYVEFGIGVDPAANGSITIAGDLDPNGRMAWSWDVGYKFVLFEGGLKLDGGQYPLVYHVGFDENYHRLTFPLSVSASKQETVELALRVDIQKMFDNLTRVDMATLSNVKFDRRDAQQLAANYRGMLSPCADDCSMGGL
jgi:methanobactin biosynthesis MbnP-like protein